jgi:hypothetical protein
MSQQTKAKKRVKERLAPKPLDAALASAIQEIGAFIEASSDTTELRRASRVVRNLAYIAALKANAHQDRIAGSVATATQHERSIERLYAEFPTEAKW